MIKKENKKIEFEILIVILEIFLLVSISVSSSYLIHKSSSLIEETIVEKNSKSLIGNGINLLIGFLSIKEIGIVSAKTTGCCIDDCIDSEEEFCDENWVPTSCDSTTQCNIGTCIDRDGGTCSAGAAKQICEADGGEWVDEEDINKVNDCQFGCCTLDGGASKQFVRKSKCVKEEGVFDSSVSETSCRIYTENMGACIFGKNDCRFTTEKDCETNLNGGFHLGVLCSNPDLDTVCEKPSTQNTKTKCYNDKVYFLDSCGNLANVYDSSRFNDDDYWKYVQEPSCEEGANVGSKSCGNCDGANSICSSASEQGINPDYGDYVCKDLSCIDENGNKRKNTEAWCVYEGYVGDSKDVVGSEYRIRWCDGGDIKTDLCGNGRAKICGERELEFEDGDSISLARCRFNEGWKCLALETVPYEFNDKGTITNQDEVDKYAEECETLSDCRVVDVNMRDIGEEEFSHFYGQTNKDEFLLFKACVPEYPIGLDFWNPEENAKDMCSIGSVSIPVVEKKQLIGGWTCTVNCNVLEEEFIEQMNEYCISLGDCGGYVNVEEKYTKNFDVKEGYDEDLDSDIKKGYRKNAKSEEGDFPLFFSSSEKGSFGGDPLDQIMSEEVGFGFGAYIGLGLIGGLAGGLVGFGAVQLGIITLAEGATIFGPIGWGFAIGAAIIIGILYLFGVGDTREIIVEFKCEPWQAPFGGDDCEKCDDDPLRPCTEYKCRSLGAGCRLIDEDELYESENPVCIYKYVADTSPPQIKLENIDEEIYSVEEKNNGIEIKRIDGECIKEFSFFNFSLRTENKDGEDDYARCIYNLESVNLDISTYQLTGEEFKEGNFFSVNHTFDKRLPFVSSLDSADITGNVKGEREGELNMHVRCVDYSGNFNFNEYVINLCLKEGPDNEPARIIKYAPKDGSFLKYQEISNVLTIYLDEPADCKWSHNADRLYDDMENDFDCFYNDNHPELGGTCTGEITELTSSENKIYIKCKDQPWISKIGYDGPWKNSNRNVNEQDFVYNLIATSNPLEISLISPQGELVRGENEKEFDLEVTTSGGANKGISKCKYEFVESPSGINSWDIFPQKDTIHTYSFNWNSGHYNILITCEDDAGNEAQKNAVFDLSVDGLPPSIVRLYKEGGSLKIITNEDAKCYYDSSSCSFNLEEGISMTTAFSNVHVTDWNPGSTYYIKCKDIFDNVNSDCVNKIIPSA